MKSMMGELTDTTNRAEGFALLPITWCFGATMGYVLETLCIINSLTRLQAFVGRHFISSTRTLPEDFCRKILEGVPIFSSMPCRCKLRPICVPNHSILSQRSRKICIFCWWLIPINRPCYRRYRSVNSPKTVAVVIHKTMDNPPHSANSSSTTPSSSQSPTTSSFHSYPSPCPPSSHYSSHRRSKSADSISTHPKSVASSVHTEPQAPSFKRCFPLVSSVILALARPSSCPGSSWYLSFCCSLQSTLLPWHSGNDRPWSGHWPSSSSPAPSSSTWVTVRFLEWFFHLSWLFLVVVVAP